MHTESEKASTPVEVPDLNPPNRAERWRKVVNLVVAVLLGVWVLFDLIEKFPRGPLLWWGYALLLAGGIGSWLYWYGRFWFLQWLLLRRWRAEPSLPFTRRPRFSRSRKAALAWGVTLVLLSGLEEVGVAGVDFDFSRTSSTTYSMKFYESRREVLNEGAGVLAELSGRPVDCDIYCSPKGRTCEALRGLLPCGGASVREGELTNLRIDVSHEGEGFYCLPYFGTDNFFRFYLEVYGNTTQGEVRRTIFRQYRISSHRASGSCRSLHEAIGQQAARVIQDELRRVLSPDLQ